MPAAIAGLEFRIQTIRHRNPVRLAVALHYLTVPSSRWRKPAVLFVARAGEATCRLRAQGCFIKLVAWVATRQGQTPASRDCAERRPPGASWHDLQPVPSRTRVAA